MSDLSQNQQLGKRVATSFSLVAGLSTLTCCALPALFISLGLGATLASLVSTMPWLITLSQHKSIVFTVAIISLTIAAYLHWRARNQSCPIDGFQAKYCAVFKRFSWAILSVSGAAITIGGYYAFFATPFA